MGREKAVKVGALLSFTALVFAGCTMRHYTVIKDRVDQDLTQGNRGYIQGSVPPQQAEGRPKTRKTHTLEVELANPFKIKQMPQVDETKKKGTAAEDEIQPLVSSGEVTGAMPESYAAGEEYLVQEGDTLQKISAKFYGTTKKWQKIYEANRDTLKTPDRVYPGQKLRIPQE
ncbi:MAG: LysM peptidoglycan-binding domain-containing protein [Candidatus Omnitrophota bacterium]